MSFLKKAKTFHGGVHPNEYKELTENSAFEIMPNPAQIIVPISQHIGKPANPLVKKGEEVKAGMVIAEPDGFVSVPIHTSVSGKVAKISKESNVSGAPKNAIIIKANEENEVELMPFLDPEAITPKK
jgi:electron transport complex protein RnfC